MVKKVRFNSMMKETTRKKLHELAVREGRSDSNMVEYLIDSYNTVNGDGKGQKENVERSSKAGNVIM